MKRRGLKNVYTKYVLIFMIVIILTVFILSIMITSIVGNYTRESRQKELADTALLFKTTVNSMEKEYETLEEMLRANEILLRDNLSVALFGMPECGIIILDNVGRPTFFAYRDESTYELVIKYGEEIISKDSVIRLRALPERYLTEIYETRDLAGDSAFDGFFSKSVISYSTAIGDPPENLNPDMNDEEEDEDERPIGENEEGVVISFSGAQGQTDMAEEMMTTIIVTVIWISIVALIAIYGVSYSVMKPLREISNAAKDFSHGKYSVRVPVRGNDEMAELATSFNNMATIVQARDEMQNNFLSSASHDLRTPMTTISGFVDGILDGAIPPEKQTYYLNIIKNETKRLSRLITSLLDISRLQSGERKFEMTTFNISELVRQTVISFEKQIEEKSLDVEFDLDDFDIMVVGDKDAINQVIYNLCHNAIKFSYEKGKYIVKIKDEGSKVRFSIYNEGIGIIKEELPFVFDRFYKSDKSRGLDKTGAGLGLFITKTIIVAHEEEIKVDSEYGKYCEFSFTIKKAKEEK